MSAAVAQLRNPFRGHTMLSLLALLAVLAAYLGAGVWLMDAASWSDTCRPQGRNLAYMISALSCSTALLDRGWTETALFAWLWSLPIGLGIVVLVNQLRPRGGANPNSPE